MKWVEKAVQKLSTEMRHKRPATEEFQYKYSSDSDLEDTEFGDDFSAIVHNRTKEMAWGTEIWRVITTFPWSGSIICTWPIVEGHSQKLQETNTETEQQISE